MLHGWVIALASLVYLGVLFAIAFYGDRRAGAGTSIINSPYVYALSLAVYASSWTYYGSVGRAARSGVGFMPIYLGPTLVAALWWTVLRKIIRISKNNHITSIADFMASRYGKSALLGGLVTLVAVVGLVPYIALQLKAVSASVAVLTHAPGIASGRAEAGPWWSDPTLYIALLLATFTIVFGTRHLDASERHEGMVAAIAFESLVKLVAFLAVGAFVTFGIYDGFADLFARAQAVPALNALLTLHGGEAGAGGAAFGSWASLIVLSMLSIMLLPRQFQIAVVENMDESHVAKAVWVLPLYLLAINVFVLPIAFGGTMLFSGGAVDPDMFVLALPMREHQLALTLFVFIGGLSAAIGMVIVETIALSTMVCNDIVIPVLLRLQSLQSERRANFRRLLLTTRRAAIVLLMMLGYAYFRLAGEAYALVSIGLISFAAVAQFAPAMLGAIYWKDGTRLGALTGLSAGFLLWAYTLLLPSFAESGWLPRGFLAHGPLGIEWLRPRQLFGLQGLDEVSHALFWSMLANVAGFVGVSLASGQSVVEKTQAALFVDAYAPTGDALRPDIWRGSASTEAVLELLRRFLGSASADDAYARFHHERGATNSPTADADLVRFAERQLAGAIGAASARAMIATVVDEEPLGLNEVMAILDETSQVVAYSHQLEQKSRELESASAELKAANARLSELDRMKDDFISTVTHELRTPLTSIRAFSEILREHPDLPAAKRGEYLDIVIKESERLTRLINNVLDLAKMESGSAQWHAEPLDLKQVIEDAVNASRQMFAEQRIVLELDLPAAVPQVLGDHDRLMQVMLNLLSNAAKFCDRAGGRVAVRLVRVGAALRVEVRDNGPGVRAQDRELIFEKFRQGGDTLSVKPQGTGLGLPISREIVRHFGGTLRLESAPGEPGEPGEGEGAVFVFTLPLASATETSHDL